MKLLAGLAVATLLSAGPLCAVAVPQEAPQADPAAAQGVPPKPEAPPSLLERLMPIQVNVGDGGPGKGESRDLSTAVEIVVLLTFLSLLPPLVLSVTCFTRIAIVLSFVRRAMGTPELPPTPGLIGLSLFLTGAVMAPVGREIHAKAIAPYLDGKVAFAPA